MGSGYQPQRRILLFKEREDSFKNLPGFDPMALPAQPIVVMQNELLNVLNKKLNGLP